MPFYAHSVIVASVWCVLCMMRFKHICVECIDYRHYVGSYNCHNNKCAVI